MFSDIEDFSEFPHVSLGPAVGGVRQTENRAQQPRTLALDRALEKARKFLVKNQTQRDELIILIRTPV